MRYLALACDYDGTLASDGKVSETTLAALDRVRASGRRLVLVSGRKLDDLRRVFDHLDIFDRAVLENGGLLYRPKTREIQPLAEPPPCALVDALRARNVPLSVGHAIVATGHPHEGAVTQAIAELGLQLHAIFNKGAVMVLPTGVNKGTGLAAALEELGLSPNNAVGIGDAENDHAFLRLCGCAVAVSNALPAVADRCDLVTHGGHGAGVEELVTMLVDDDLAAVRPRLARHKR